jgi:hypothetical protein
MIGAIAGKKSRFFGAYVLKPNSASRPDHRMFRFVLMCFGDVSASHSTYVG